MSTSVLRVLGPVTVLGGAATMGIGIGVGLGLASSWSSTVASDDPAAESPEAASVRALPQRAILFDTMQPPVVGGLSDGTRSAAIIGAADGRYYLVDWRGLATPVHADRNRDVYWADPRDLETLSKVFRAESEDVLDAK